MDSREQPKAGEGARQGWAGYAILLVVALSTGLAPGSIAWALMPGAEGAWVEFAREQVSERAGARQSQAAFAKAVRDLLKGKKSDHAAEPDGARIVLAALPTDPPPVAVRGTHAGRFWTAAPGLLPQPPPAGVV